MPVACSANIRVSSTPAFVAIVSPGYAAAAGCGGKSFQIKATLWPKGHAGALFLIAMCRFSEERPHCAHTT